MVGLRSPSGTCILLALVLCLVGFGDPIFHLAFRGVSCRGPNLRSTGWPMADHRAKISGVSSDEVFQSSSWGAAIGVASFPLMCLAVRRGGQSVRLSSPPDLAAAEEEADFELAKEEAYADGQPKEKTVETMRKFAVQYAKLTGTFFCSDRAVPSVVVTGLAHHKETLGAPLCPCRHYEDKEAEAKNGYWNCPCVPMRERHECHCMLFLTDSNPFASDSQTLELEEIIGVTKDH